MPITFPQRGLSYEEQLQHMKDSGLIVHDDAAAISALRQVSYYRLRGYYLQWYDKKTKRFSPNTSFDEIVRIHQFDMDLTALILNVTSHIEIALRAYLANEISFISHAMGYVDLQCFSEADLFMKNTGKIEYEISRSKEVFIEHYKDNYQKRVPVWAAVEVMSFGTLSKLFKSLDKKIKVVITKEYYKRGSYFSWVESWLQAVSIVRNMCAHRARLYNCLTDARPLLLKKDQAETVNNQTIYGALLAMKYLTENNPDIPNWIITLKGLLSEYIDVVQLTRLGFPEDWEEHLQLNKRV